MTLCFLSKAQTRTEMHAFLRCGGRWCFRDLPLGLPSIDSSILGSRSGLLVKQLALSLNQPIHENDCEINPHLDQVPVTNGQHVGCESLQPSSRRRRSSKRMRLRSSSRGQIGIWSPACFVRGIPVGYTPDRPIRVAPVGAVGVFLVMAFSGFAGGHWCSQQGLGLRPGLPPPSLSPPLEGRAEAGGVGGGVFLLVSPLWEAQV